MPKVALSPVGTIAARIRSAGLVPPEQDVSSTATAFDQSFENTETGDVHNWRIVPVGWEEPPVFQQFVGVEEIIFTVFTAPRTDGLII